MSPILRRNRWTGRIAARQSRQRFCRAIVCCRSLHGHPAVSVDRRRSIGSFQVAFGLWGRLKPLKLRHSVPSPVGEGLLRLRKSWFVRQLFCPLPNPPPRGRGRFAGDFQVVFGSAGCFRCAGRLKPRPPYKNRAAVRYKTQTGLHHRPVHPACAICVRVR